MKKLALAVLVGIFCLGATSAFAQTKQFIKSLNLAKIERVLPKGASLTPKIPGVYIPAGTNWVALERKVATAAQTAGFNLNARDARIIAYNPALLRQFEQEVGHPVFEGHPLPYEKGLATLRRNQAKFAQERANNEYDAKWAEFTKEHSVLLSDGSSSHVGNNQYNAFSEFAEDVYNFYTKYIGFENLPRMRNVFASDIEQVVCEFPIDSFRLLGANVDIPAKDYVVIVTNRNATTLVPRYILESQTDYRVIK